MRDKFRAFYVWFTSLFASVFLRKAKVNPAQATEAEADTEAYSKKQQAKAAKWQTIFQALGRQFRLSFRRWATYRNQRLARKIVHERAKTEKWRQIENAMSKFFTALRREIRIVFVLMWRLSKARTSKFLGKFADKVGWTVSILLALFFALVTFIGIIANNAWIWSIAPLGVVLSLVAYPLIVKRGFLINLARVVFVNLTFLWAGSWLIFLFAPRS